MSTARFDYMINQDNLVAVVAVNNNNGSVTPIPALLASSYNSIAVGLSNGQSSLGPVPTSRRRRWSRSLQTGHRRA